MKRARTISRDRSDRRPVCISAIMVSVLSGLRFPVHLSYRLFYPLPLIVALLSTALHAASPEPPVVWKNNAIGRDEIVLPQFDPIRTDGLSIVLDGVRSYEWNEDGLLPARIRHAGNSVAQGMFLRVKVDGELQELIADSPPQIVNVGGHHANVVASSVIGKGVSVRVSTRVEYDGVAMVSIELQASPQARLEYLDLTLVVDAPQSARLLRFDAKTIRKRKKRFVFPIDYQGGFSNAFGIATGEHSFWFFADDARNWVFDESPALTIERTEPDTAVIRQVLIARPSTISGTRTLKINFLATPIKTGADWRRTRVALNGGREEGRYGSVQLWWIDAFAHQTLPYTVIPAGAESRLPRHDVEHYKGAAAGRRIIHDARRNGVHRLPYFSAHALSAIDPMFVAFGDQWAARPPYVIPESSDGPFTSKLSRPWLSHRSPEYADYLLSRFDKLIDELGFTGLYFDQGGVIDSVNADHAWTDANDRIRSATDILGMRMFFKRLATLFYLKGKPGYIFVHNSASPVIPAYTFVSGMVQGEEYRVRMNKPDYITNVDIAELRSAYSPGQYGIPTYWLSVLWSKHMRMRGEMARREWFETRDYRHGLNGYFGLAMLHDIQMWTSAPLKMRRPLIEYLDRNKIYRAKFRGYWLSPMRQSGNFVLASHYLQYRSGTALTVLVNTTDVAQMFRHPVGDAFIGCSDPGPLELGGSFGIEDLSFDAQIAHGKLQAGEFGILDIRFESTESASCGM